MLSNFCGCTAHGWPLTCVTFCGFLYGTFLSGWACLSQWCSGQSLALWTLSRLVALRISCIGSFPKVQQTVGTEHQWPLIVVVVWQVEESLTSTNGSSPHQYLFTLHKNASFDCPYDPKDGVLGCLGLAHILCKVCSRLSPTLALHSQNAVSTVVNTGLTLVPKSRPSGLPVPQKRFVLSASIADWKLARRNSKSDLSSLYWVSQVFPNLVPLWRCDATSTSYSCCKWMTISLLVWWWNCTHTYQEWLVLAMANAAQRHHCLMIH